MKINQLNSCILKTVLKSENASLARLYSALFNIFLLSPKRIRTVQYRQTIPLFSLFLVKTEEKKKEKKKVRFFFHLLIIILMIIIIIFVGFNILIRSTERISFYFTVSVVLCSKPT